MQVATAQTWHTASAPEVAEALGVDTRRGLSTAEVAERSAEHGPNLIAEVAGTPAWRKVLSLLADKMTLVLVVAAVVSAVVSREWETPVVIFAVIALNTVLNFVQERRAENSLQALKDMSVSTTRVRRDGREQSLPREQLVPGDIVLLESGDSVPADGRLVQAVRLQVAEAALTGESHPVDKSIDPVEAPDAPLGDRTDMLFMNTEVTRGRAEMVVTATGMGTEMGAIATLLGGAGVEQTPLQRRIGQLAQTLTIVAIVTVALVFVLGLLRGQTWSDLLVTAVSLAVATIPEGLTAVVAFTLAMGASRLAARGAIVKQLAAVETLGSTTHIATDKTGTLTLNEMTVQRLLVRGRTFRVTGSGYGTDGKILVGDGLPTPDFTDALLAMGLCNDATVRDGVLVGDPTEGALVVLAEKGGIDVDGARAAHPRLAEVPFDSAYKFMATFHALPEGRFRCFAKGAPGALLERAVTVDSSDGPVPLDDEGRRQIREAVNGLASDGLRTLMIAGRDLDAVPRGDSDALHDLVSDLTVYAVVGIVDPPRTEAKAAIEVAHEAGIAVHMITGDHLVTASAIAGQLGIGGTAASGSDLDALDDDELRTRAEGFGVLARVAPEHKIRYVKALQADGQIVAMTGDGVNDAPALEQADIGVAMGITGTDVSKGAANMILTDDNFATIVAAVAEGRGIYDNIVKFVKFQLTTAWGFVLIFLAAGALGLAGGAPFTALQILWVNIIMDGPPALALGVDPTEPDAMKRRPRPVKEALLTRSRIQRILGLGIVMAVGTLLVLRFGPDLFPDSADDPLFATTLAFTTFVFFQVFNLFNVRSNIGSVFSLQTLTNHTIWIAIGVVIVLQICVVQASPLQSLFDTTSLTGTQWLLAIAVGSVVLWVDEIGKAIARARRRD
ncbi:calcium-translocating P-type ATPase, PMCA-type [Rhodococcus coprophilus]|uniref:P-type Ca(2+) transporter n=1 Tax=Rhodococcus coprophilus TaxID=38310 RepID=A0A2X4UEQ1_9NOCA|nr:calcium-translocating P-type ATPase, PMCA-type [Rhodococcus coprophilus]MBM7458595.1 Ca2+-transporting ATPase [Rhodococcus coprophilus]SQI33002.1 calcium-transporting ATPase [Rhodococcus coprophilus]